MSRNSERAANYRKNHLSNLDKNDFSFKLALSYMLGMAIDELEEFVNNSISKPGSYVILEKETYDKMMSSLSESFKAGEDKERERHLKEEDEAFKRGVKYGEEKKENEIRIKTKEPDNWVERERRRYSDYPGWLEEERKKVSDPPDWYIKEQEKYSDPHDDLSEKNQKIFNDFKKYFSDKILLPEDGIFSGILINRMHDMLKNLQK